MENKKTRVLNAIRRVSQDCLPTQTDATPEMLLKIQRIMHIDQNQFDEKMDNHINYLILDDRVRIDAEEGVQFDVWGVGWDLVLTEGFHIRHHPLIECDDLREYKFPEPDDSLFRSIGKLDEKSRKEFYILFDQGWTLFERLWLLRGFENSLADLYFRQNEVEYLLDGITEYNIEIARKLIKLGVAEGAYTGDDFGTQREMLISPQMWRKFFKQRYKKLWGIYKSSRIDVFHHSCGNIIGIIPDLIDLGLDVLTPIQPEAMNISELIRSFGKYLSFLGGISTQTTLPFGSPGKVRSEVIESIMILGKYNGYIISPSHEITSDCPDENFLALFEALNDYKSGKLKVQLKIKN